MSTSNSIRILVIGAGSRGTAYSESISRLPNAAIAAVAEPIAFKRQELGRKHIWPGRSPAAHEEFTSWSQFLEYETTRREREKAGEDVQSGVDAVFICVLDTQHAAVVKGLAPLKLHVLCEKPLATNLRDCLDVWGALRSEERVFGVCHVLRYSPHNMLLRRLVREEECVGEVVSVEHVEPVGWWHFTHSYVRGNWRKESTTAPDLLTKSCHDIDFLMWLLCSPVAEDGSEQPHLPSQISSFGSLKYFKRSRKPAGAGEATNCLSCPIEHECIYSAKKIYLDGHLKKGNANWPVKIVNPEIEDLLLSSGPKAAEEKLLSALEEDYGAETAKQDVQARPWFGRCVWESDNDVCDDQVVTIEWEDEPSTRTATNGVSNGTAQQAKSRSAKTASFHMIAYTEAQCERRGRIYGTTGELEYDSKRIAVYDFGTGERKTYYPEQPGGGHGGGDDGLIEQFISAVDAVRKGDMSIQAAQRKYLGCDVHEAVRSHAAVFAAEEARRERTVLAWSEWWEREVESYLDARKQIAELMGLPSPPHSVRDVPAQLRPKQAA